jgi:hypothetical protein
VFGTIPSDFNVKNVKVIKLFFLLSLMLWLNKLVFLVLSQVFGLSGMSNKSNFFSSLMLRLSKLACSWLECQGCQMSLLIDIIFKESIVASRAIVRSFSWLALMARGISIRISQWLGGARTHPKYPLV